MIFPFSYGFPCEAASPGFSKIWHGFNPQKMADDGIKSEDEKSSF